MCTYAQGTANNITPNGPEVETPSFMRLQTIKKVPGPRKSFPFTYSLHG